LKIFHLIRAQLGIDATCAKSFFESSDLITFSRNSLERFPTNSDGPHVMRVRTLRSSTIYETPSRIPRGALDANDTRVDTMANTLPVAYQPLAVLPFFTR
jgi:hypothetical protein